MHDLFRKPETAFRDHALRVTAGRVAADADRRDGAGRASRRSSRPGSRCIRSTARFRCRGSRCAGGWNSVIQRPVKRIRQPWVIASPFPADLCAATLDCFSPDSPARARSPVPGAETPYAILAALERHWGVSSYNSDRMALSSRKRIAPSLLVSAITKRTRPCLEVSA